MSADAAPEQMSLPLGRVSRRWRRIWVRARRANLFAWLEAGAAIALLTMVATSYLALSNAPASGAPLPTELAAALLIGTLIPGLALVVLFGRRVAIRRAGGTTARLHVNLVFFFSLVAAIPTLLVAVFASFLFQSGYELYFSSQSRGILENARTLARGYYEQSQRSLANNTVTMASDVRDFLQRYPLTDPRLPDEYYIQAFQRELNRSAILQEGPDGSLSIALILNPEEGDAVKRAATVALAEIKAGEPYFVAARADRIEAMAPIDATAGIYLYNARDSDTLARDQWERAQSVLASYGVLTQRARALQVRFNLALFALSLALVGLAVWFALRFADRQVKPLKELVGAAREVGSGNFALRVAGRTGLDEIGLLNRAFNRMTSQIERQTDALVGANKQLAERRAFIETVLQSITAGIVSVDAGGKVLLMNASAQELLLDRQGPAPVGLELEDIAAQFSVLLRSGASSGIVQYGKGGELLTLAVKIAPSADGYVITFEDITRQLLDQRQAAWSDVARRIAHEIKNPLTPIQLAAERLKRRYRRQIDEDGALFEELTQTIIRQVGELRTMVDEFSSFARMPKPVFRQEDPVDLVRQALFLQEVARPEIDYAFAAEGEIAAVACDRHQFGQAMTNVLKNAAEAIDSRGRDAGADYRGRIVVGVTIAPEYLTVTVTDNGIGLPQGGERIMEPYVTTREKGTGLGLAIVKKIVEEHGGDVNFTAAEGGGTRATLRFARDPMAANGDEAAA